MECACNSQFGEPSLDQPHAPRAQPVVSIIRPVGEEDVPGLAREPSRLLLQTEEVLGEGLTRRKGVERVSSVEFANARDTLAAKRDVSPSGPCGSGLLKEWSYQRNSYQDCPRGDLFIAP